jgi:hypothetical protein
MTEPLQRMMSNNSHEELYRVLLDTAHEAPVEVVANCIEVMAVVLNKRLHDRPDWMPPDDEFDACG